MTEDYNVDFNDILGYGNYGTVYGANKKTDEKLRYAVKVFKSAEASAEEISIMEYLSQYKFTDVANIVEVLTLNGRKAIVMERLDGGEVFERILNDGHFSEHKAAKCLVNLVRALIDLNKKAYVLHRDVKPENLVYISQDPESEVKLIDFGLAIRASPFSIEQGLRLGKRPAGTASYMSPETIRNCEYSAKSDVWSAGVTLYALLSGTAPFDQDNRIKQRQQILAGQFAPLDSAQWNHVSNEAKELVKSMLTVNPTDRISLEDILNHPWIKTAKTASNVEFGERYMNDMRSLSARSNFKKIVNATVLTIRLRRIALTTILSSGAPGGMTTRKSFSAPVGATEFGASQTIMEVDENDALSPIDSVKRQSTELPGFSLEQIKELKERFNEAAIETAKRRGMSPPPPDSRDLAVDYDAFASVMYAVGLEAFATPHVFHVFDSDGNGMVDYREFISTLAVFRGNDQDTWRLYFDMFDIDGSGEITFDELKLVMAALLHDDTPEDHHDENDRSSPAPEAVPFESIGSFTQPGKMSSQSSSVVSPQNHSSNSSMIAEDLLSSDSIDVVGSVFKFVPDNGKGISLAHPGLNSKGESVEALSAPHTPVKLGQLPADASISTRGSRVASFQTVFRFAKDKMNEAKSIEDLFREMDTNKDGKISFEEFKGWMQRDMDKLKNVVQEAII